MSDIEEIRRRLREARVAQGLPVSSKGEQTIELPNLVEGQEVKYEVKSDPNLVKKLSFFVDQFKPKVGLIYYPCCETDISPSLSFSQSKVVYVDFNEKAVNCLKDQGFEAYQASALDYNPGEVDVLLLVNPGISPESPAEHVRVGGYLLCNNHHGTAAELVGNQEFELVGLVNDKEESCVLETQSSSDYFVEVGTDEEFEQADNDSSSVSYKKACELVLEITNQSQDILANYKILLHQAEEQKRKIEEGGGMVLELPYLELKDGEKIYKLVKLPNKKKSRTEVFIFKKKDKE